MRDTQSNGAAAPSDHIVYGAALMALAMFIIPIRDGIAKYMTGDLPVFTIAWGTYVAALP